MTFLKATAMIIKTILLVFLFVFPIYAIEYLFPGIFIAPGFLASLAIAALCGITVSLTDPVMQFLTFKQNIITRSLILFVLLALVLYLFSIFTNSLTINKGIIDLVSIFHSQILGQTMLQLTAIEDLVVSSLLLTIWGIMMHILLKFVSK